MNAWTLWGMAVGTGLGMTIGSLVWGRLYREAYAGWMRCLDGWGDTLKALEGANALIKEMNRNGIN